MSRAAKPVGYVPEPNLRWLTPPGKAPHWRAWARARFRDEDTTSTLVEGTSNQRGDAGRAEARRRFEAAVARHRQAALPQGGVDVADYERRRTLTPTVLEAAEEWVSWRSIRESSKATYRSAIRSSLAPLHNVEVSQVTPAMAYDLLSNVGPKAAETAYAVLAGTFARAVNLRHIAVSPITKGILPQKGPDSQKVKRRLTIGEVFDLRERFLVAQNLPRRQMPLYTVSELMLRTAGRIGELLVLRVGDVAPIIDIAASELLQGATISITGTQGVNPDGTLARHEHTKTGETGRRVVVVSADFYRETLAPLCANRPASAWLFAAREWTPRAATLAANRMALGSRESMVSAANFRRSWRAVLAETEYHDADCTPHTYRRTVAQNLVDAGEVELAAALLGHSGLATLYRSYADRPIPVVNPSAQLDALFAQVRGPQTDAEWRELYGPDFD